uniref:W2 domain-containing protein n=1 Tax=Globodera rostochiensis TaxID=31243 RepID=A0A914HL05_GLORO
MDKQKQQQLDVLIILDKSSEITPLAHDKTYAPNRSFNDLCVQWVSKLNSPNVIVAFVNQPEEIAVKFLTKWSSSLKQLQAFCVHNCQSLNDVLREIESRQMLRNDFVLIQNCATFCSSYLARQIEKFKNGRRQNKKNVLTLLYYEKFEDRRIADEGQSLLGYHEQTQKLTHYENIKKDEAVSIHKNAFLMDTIFRSDLTSCGIALCGIEFSGHFAGNYDFHTFDAIISDILSNEEILAQNIHVDFVDDFIRSSSTSPAENKLVLGADVRGASSISLSTSIDNLLDELDGPENAKTDTERSDPVDDVCQIEQGHWKMLLRLEINASKLAYNIPLDEVPNHLFSAFLRLPGVVDKFSNFTKMYNYWYGLWKVYYKTAAAQSQMLFAIEENTAISDRFRRILPNVLFFLSQDVKVLDDVLIVDWYNSKLESNSPLKNEEKLAELVRWIQNAAEESSDSDEQDEEEGERRA